MYDELVKMLRVCGDSNNSCGNCPIRENDGSCPHGEWEFAAEEYMLQAADAIEELIAERDKYKWHSDSILELPDCNTCGKKRTGDCEFMPAYGDYVRINCAFWTPEPPKEES